MKFNLVNFAASMILGLMAVSSPTSAVAGWGVLGGGSSGGSSGFSSVGGSSGGYAVSYASGGSSGYTAYSSVGGSSGGSSGGPGILRRVAGRIHDHFAAKHARHAARRAYYGSSGYASVGGSSGGVAYSSSGGGSSGGYVSSYSGGSSGGTSVSYGSSGASYGSSGVSYGSTGYSSGISYGSTGYSSGMSYGSAGETYYGASTATDSAVSSLVSNVETISDAVYLTVAVPNDAKIFVNNNATTSTGAVRKFVSRGLESGKEYRFQIRAEMTAADGKLLTEEKTLVVTAGQQEQVQFAFADSESPVETAITLNLPAGAKVLLAGNETNATGENRTYRTRRLKPGEFWDNYQIEVQYEGRVKTQSLRLIGGDSLQLTFDFNPTTDNLAAK